jgi:hypothetical protein
LEDVWGMLQVLLGQPEVLLRAIALKPYQVLWLSTGANQLMGNNIFHPELFFTFHQLGWGAW